MTGARDEDTMTRSTRPPDSRWDSPIAVVAAILWLVLLIWLGPRALDADYANHPTHEVTR